jgi:adenylate cyclase
MADPALEIAETMRLARRAVALGKDDAGALAWGGLGLALVGRELDDGAAFVDQALTLNPNLATAWHVSALIRLWLGEPEVALEHEARAMRLSPLDPLIGQMQSATAWAYLSAGRCDDASSWAGRAMREMPSWVPAHIVAAASNALAGRSDAAQQAAANLRQLSPTFRLSQVGNIFPLRRPEDLTRLVDGLRRAGLPE